MAQYLSLQLSVKCLVGKKQQKIDTRNLGNNLINDISGQNN